MPQDNTATVGGKGPQGAVIAKRIEPSLRTAIPHYIPLGVFPLIFLAAAFGGWWLLAPFLFFVLAGPLDRALGEDGRNIDTTRAPARRLVWHNLPVWGWAFLWLPALVFGLWQILVANAFALWEDVILAIILTLEARAVFIVGHELIHRRTPWERRLGEILLSCASYPQFATEHVYVHHAEVGTPRDAGSPPKGVSFWQYFPREVRCNITHSWKSAVTMLARRRLPAWHYSNPFWRYALYMGFWCGLLFWMGGIWAVPVFVLLGLSCVFSMKISNYMQHYGLRRVRLPNGRWERVAPRHSWSADWKFSNWMFFNMQRHADHHALASRQYPLLQFYGAEESPLLPGTYSELMILALRPKRWFEKMDPLVDQWRAHFYPEIDDWSPYDSPVAAARPESHDDIIEIYGNAPRLAAWIERNPELLDNLQSREFTELDLPKGFMDDAEVETIARSGLARVYWMLDMNVDEMKEQLAEIPAADARESAVIVRNWSNDKAFQIGMHVLRETLSPSEAGAALSNLAEASIHTVLSAVVADFDDRDRMPSEGGSAAVLLGNLASGEAHPGAEVEVLFVHGGGGAGKNERLCARFGEVLASLAQNSLLFAPVSGGARSIAVLPLDGLAEHCRGEDWSKAIDLTRARCVFETGDAGIGARFDEVRREVLSEAAANASLIAELRRPAAGAEQAGVSSFVDTRGGLEDLERAARLLRLTGNSEAFDEPAPAASSLFGDSGALAEAAALWRDLQGVVRLVGEEDFDASAARPGVQAQIASACGKEDFEALNAAVAETARRAAAEIDALAARA